MEFDGRILITILVEKKIVVLGNAQELDWTINLTCRCRGIAKKQDRCLIGRREFIEEFRTDFSHLKSRLKDITGDIAVDGHGRVVFGHNRKSTITKEDPDRINKVIFTFKHENREGPYGLAIDNNGFIFVNGRDSGNIHILSEDGHLRKIFDIDSPLCIKFKKNSQRFFVTNDKGVVKIFETTW